MGAAYNHVVGIKKIVVLSDLHCGSAVGLLPPALAETEDTLALRQNKVQEWLWRCWSDFTNRWLPIVLGGDPYALVVNGDLIDGVHHGTTQVIPDVVVQAKIARSLLTPLAFAAKATYVVRGTECHTRQSETIIGEWLGAKQEPGTKSFAWDNLTLKANGCPVSFSHHITTAAKPWSESAALANHLVAEQFRAQNRGWETPKVVVRSHRHVYGTFENGGGMMVVTPSWQAMTRYAKAVTADNVSTIGGVVLDFTGDEGALPLVHRKLYTPKQARAETL